jgi:hypothetical protein
MHILVYNKQLLHNSSWKRETYIYTGTLTYWTKENCHYLDATLIEILQNY